MAISWCFDKKSQDVALWAIGYSLLSIGQMLQSLRGIVPESIGSGAGVMFIFVGIGIVWIGFRAFDGFSRPYVVAFVPAAVWITLYFGAPQIFNLPNNRITLFSLIIVAQLATIMLSIWHGWKRERLPSRILIIILGAVYCVITVVKVAISLFYPLTEVNGIALMSWYGVLMFILYANALGMGFGVFALGRERSLRQYKHASETDMLTGVLNRRAFYDRASKKFAEAGGTLALIDLDHFKHVNDRYGHAGGDEVLRRFTAMVSNHMTKDMIFCRMGGEEFGLFIPQSHISEIINFCESIRSTVSQTPIIWKDETIHITISIGIFHERYVGKGLETGLMHADTSLYRAKNQGRNCVVSGPAMVETNAIIA
ncbi:GGDEF domain-containing protein [Rhizobium sp.]|uniref:GGDEF domain-containing protein n=1 Tax=Rhizobium sp. TaxID=391 RepID=UPI000E99ABF3|nr:hypothetical protein [Rhizobium sp.]